jgi:hypothetical protein
MMQANAGIILEGVLIFGGVLVFGLWQIYAAKRDTRRANELEAAKKLAANGEGESLAKSTQNNAAVSTEETKRSFK